MFFGFKLLLRRLARRYFEKQITVIYAAVAIDEYKVRIMRDPKPYIAAVKRDLVRKIAYEMEEKNLIVFEEHKEVDRFVVTIRAKVHVI